MNIEDQKKHLTDRIEENHKHHPPKTQARVDAHQEVRRVTAECAKALVGLCSPGRELSFALTAMEEAMMWANAAIARSESDE